MITAQSVTTEYGKCVNSYKIQQSFFKSHDKNVA